MPLPRITGLLNNCALNAALPILLNEIEKLSEQERAGALNIDSHNIIVKSYERLKTIFAEQYGFNTNPTFTWQAFHVFLSAHSFYENEIILAPILRNFIAQIGATSGYDNVSLLRDVQPDGRYNLLHYREAWTLLHNHFGISLRTYNFIADRNTSDPKDNYELITILRTTNQNYPFGNTPEIEMFLKNEHFEIQPHESLAEANSQFVGEINRLTPMLASIHNDLSCSQQAHTSNEQLGFLCVYVNTTLVAQLKRAPIVENRVVKPEQAGQIEHPYAMSAQAYAISGRACHSDTPAGRQTFAVILLIILEMELKKQSTTVLLNELDRSDPNKDCPPPIGAYLLDQLATAVIASQANLTDVRVVNAITAIERNKSDNKNMSTHEDLLDDRKKLISAARKTVEEAWQLYQQTNNQELIEIIQQTQTIACKPTRENLDAYNTLRKKVTYGKGNLSEKIVGLMLTVAGLALSVLGVLSIVGSLGFAAPVSIPAIAAGIGFFAVGAVSLTASHHYIASGIDKSLYQKMKHTSESAESTLKRDSSIPTGMSN